MLIQFVLQLNVAQLAQLIWPTLDCVCPIRLSGLSPFMGDSDNETLSNVTSATWDFEDEAFDEISDNAKDFITNLLKKDMK